MNKKRSSSKRKVKAEQVTHPLSSKVQFTNREIGWLNFNFRVLNEAKDLRNPLLERIKFLSISSSNLDEFFMKRVGRLKRHQALGFTARSADGKTSAEQLIEIRSEVQKMLLDQSSVAQKILTHDLPDLGIQILPYSSLQKADLEWLQKFYKKNVFPVLTPLSVDPGHPFPFMSNLSISFGVSLRHPERAITDDLVFARVKVPLVLPQWIELPEVGTDTRFVSLLDVMQSNMSGLFPNLEVVNVMAFRLTRNADVSKDDEDADDLVELIEEELRLRRFAEVVRLEHGANADPWILKLLKDELEITDPDVFAVNTELDLTRLLFLGDLNLPKEKFSHFTGGTPLVFQTDDPAQMFAEIRKSEQLLHHPFDLFSSTAEKFVRLSAGDPKVLAIKMTLYRTGDKSPMIRSLIRAAEDGKQVVVLIELKARFDEERNIYWAQELESAGVHVVYGVLGFKTHAKTALVVRDDPDGLRSYAHFGTGNYNSQTAKLYTDLGLITAEPEITAELGEFFNYLTGISLKGQYNHLLIAPINMFAKFRELIQTEAEHCKAGRPSGVFAKMNSMEENDIGWSLYEASKAGVPIDLLVRGFCSLRPGVKDLSPSLKVSSIVGRFLEHSRLFYFRNGQADPIDGLFYIGSADWMYRNLHSRVECIVPIKTRSLRQELWTLIEMYKADQRQTWDMKSDGSYSQRKSTGQGIHQELMKRTIAEMKKIGEI